MFSLSAPVLKRLSGIQRRSTQDAKPRADDIGIQRFHDRERSQEIREFIDFGYPWSDLSAKKRESAEFGDLQKPGWLPSAIIVNIPRAGVQRRGVSLAPRDALTVQDNDDGMTATIDFPPKALLESWRPQGLHPIEVIDGQHRLWAFEEGDRTDFELPVVAFYDLDVSWQAYLFWTINIKPKRINPSLAFDLYPLLRSENWLDKFAGHPIYRETRAQELVEALWSHTKSPWFHRINMLGETGAQSGDHRPLVTQNAWVRALMATYVKSWEGPGTRIGGLFGSESAQHEPMLAWTRTQQAAFLIYVWQCIRDAVVASRAAWARELRHVTNDPKAPPSLDAAFDGPFSLFTTDQGVRGILAISNDMCYTRHQELELSSWRASDEASAVDEEAVTAAIRALKRLPVARFVEKLATAVVKYDWRSSSFPGLNQDEQRTKRALRGSGGYRQLREDLLTQLSKEHGDIGSAADVVRNRLGYN